MPHFNYLNFFTVTYINCSAEVKALSDVICTSGNAKKIVEQCPPDKDLLFVPDENLGQWVMEQTGRPMTLWQGNCYVHVEWTHAAITKIVARRSIGGRQLRNLNVIVVRKPPPRSRRRLCSRREAAQ